MKKALLLLPGALFPYGLLFSLYCVFTGFLMETVFSGNIFVLLFYLLVFFIVALIGNVIFLILKCCEKMGFESGFLYEYVDKTDSNTGLYSHLCFGTPVFAYDIYLRLFYFFRYFRLPDHFSDWFDGRCRRFSLLF